MANNYYHMSTEDRTALLTAADSSEVPLRVRNKLYTALGHIVKQRTKKMSAEFIAKWERAERDGNESKFVFLQTWAQDTSGAAIVMSERFSKSATETDEISWTWVTQFDLYARKTHIPTLCK